ncbi:MAG TPA: hypothetical protein VHN14_31065 [Kofleriaceae bacterium]|jgi:hypothetical protein|nr:hypothetical protein [Kofleriaceae bacterium]
MSDGDGLRAFLERLLGWDDLSAVDRALRSVDLAATHKAALVLCGDGDLVQIARGLHRRVLGDERPFVLCDPWRRDTDARAPLENHKTGMEALRSSAGGSVCMRSERLPRDFADFVVALRDASARVHLILCGPRLPECTELVMVPIRIPAMSTRRHELDRLIGEYAHDAAITLRSLVPFTQTDRDWVRMHSATSLPEIEKGAWRLVALREAGTIARAAELLGMSHAALGEWFARRRTTRT